MQRKKFLRMVQSSVFIISMVLPCSPCFSGGASDPAAAEKDCGSGRNSACVDKRKSDLKDTRRLEEIIEKTIRITHDPSSAESAKMELPVKGTVTSKAGVRQDP